MSKNASLSEKADKKGDFEKVHGVENLYFRHSRGVYVTRVSLNGTRTWKSLETEVLTVAKLRHRKEQSDNEETRAKGGKLTSEFRTLGALAKEFEARMETSDLADSSRVGYRGHLKRLRENWQRGTFESFNVKAVSLDVIFELREQLAKSAKVMHGKPSIANRATKGYCNSVVNDTLFCLRRLVDIAIEKRVMIENPFSAGGVLRQKLNLPTQTKIPELPDRAVMDRIFVQLRTIKATLDAPGWLKKQQDFANANADFAEFLAFSGARHEEANLVKVKFYKPGIGGKCGTLYIPGYKSVSSERTIPVIPPLRRLIDPLVAGRNPEEKLLKAQSCLKALWRACAQLKVKRLTQHHMRHYFATICIEKGVDIPTVSRWLGHGDGGRLALKTYGHLRQDHSFAQAALVDFADNTTNVVSFNPGGPPIESAAQSKVV